MYGFTGTWRGQPVSVQGSGMGQPSLAIYANEVFDEYDVQTIVRVGSCGSLTEQVALRDVVIASGACTDSAMNRITFEGLDYAPVADFGLLRAAYDASTRLDATGEGGDQTVHVGLIFSSDSFYSSRPELMRRMVDYGVLAVEMEASAIFTIAAMRGVRAGCLLTVSDTIGAEIVRISDDELRNAVDNMMALALDTLNALN